MSPMEAITNARAKAKAKATPTNEPVLKNMSLTSKAKAAADDCADLAAYTNEGSVQVRRSTLEARKAGARTQEDVSQAEGEYGRR